MWDTFRKGLYIQNQDFLHDLVSVHSTSVENIITRQDERE
jgi:hypothetical protein